MTSGGSMEMACPECGADLTVAFNISPEGVFRGYTEGGLEVRVVIDSIAGCPHADAYMRGPFDDGGGEPLPVTEAA